ncbi:hypothetical protein DSM3645_22324 [Blastopirellula marina DSM 3645]|uniref:Uncharacterized protein n=1 Tax=Blastopirellula marina DSM 3645 TaxID=314230 RepID=A3ZUK8_9BACT|nr:hypothetical protein DSM3645_22324 [Blastopirellula marina DSM 3645]
MRRKYCKHRNFMLSDDCTAAFMVDLQPTIFGLPSVVMHCYFPD